MKRRAQCSLTDYYGLANGRGYLWLICFIFVPFISCCYDNKLFLFHLPPSPTCILLSPHTPFPFLILLVSHCTSSAELTKRWSDQLTSQLWSNKLKVLCHWAKMYGTQITAWTLLNQSQAKRSLLLMRQGQQQPNNVLNFRCSGRLAQGYMACRVPHVEDTAAFMHTQTPVIIGHRIHTAFCPGQPKTDSQHLRDGRTRPRQPSVTIWLGRGSD